MFSKDWFETWYDKADPWSYRSNSDDIRRKKYILNLVEKYGPFDRAIDIGCGEGFITEDIKATEVYGLEISDKAAARFKPNVKRALVPEGKYDLVLTAGTLYKEYDHAQIASWITNCASRIVIVAGIRDWLIPYNFGTEIESFELEYRDYLTQKITVYEIST